MKTILAFLPLALVACTEATAPREVNDRSSFEETLLPWRAVAIDTGTTGGAHAPWSVRRVSDAASDGSWSALVRATNHTDAVKVWLERRYSVVPSATGVFDVTISYDFGTSDFGAVNQWRIIAGAFAQRPRTAESLTPAFREETGGAPAPGTLHWLPKQYTTRLSSAGPDVYVVVGVWGTFETERAYYIDNVRVIITPAPAAP